VGIDRKTGPGGGHGYLASPGNGIHQAISRFDGVAPFYIILDQGGRPTDIGEQPEPVPALRPDLVVAAVLVGFPAEKNHGDTGGVGSTDSQSPINSTDAGMKENGRQAAADFGVAHGHTYGQSFMPAVNIFQGGFSLSLAFEQPFPDRRPLRTRGAEDIFDSARFQ